MNAVRWVRATSCNAESISLDNVRYGPRGFAAAAADGGGGGDDDDDEDPSK